MGKNNKARRAEKARAKSKARAAGGFGGSPRNRYRERWTPPPPDEPFFTQPELARNLLWLLSTQRGLDGDRRAQGLAQLTSMAQPVVDSAAEAIALDQIDAIWTGGWQPVELHRQARRDGVTAAGGRLVGWAMATDHAGRRSVDLDARWVGQIDGLDLPAVNGKAGWLGRWAAAEGLDRAATVATVVAVLGNLFSLPRLEPLLPPPGSNGGAGPAPGPRADGPAGAEADPVLQRIRGLLAKAESTTFEAEATAFTAKAQELMTRHAIDLAMVHDRPDGERERPVAIRVPIDAPYADAKSLLLQTVAEATRCRAVFHVGLGLSTVVGFPTDVAAVEMLFTSLLVQAQTALADAGRQAAAGTRTRKPSYRSAFLLSYTDRIRTRLAEINEAVYAEAEAEQGPSFLPVLRSQEADVDDFMAERFGEMRQAPVRGGYDAAGWAGGRVAADNAHLAFGDLADDGA